MNFHGKVLSSAGTFGVVYELGEDEVIKRCYSKADMVSNISEILIMEMLYNSPYIIRITGLAYTSDLCPRMNPPRTGMTDSTLCIVIERAECSLDEFINSDVLDDTVRFKHLRRVVFDVVCGLEQLRYSGIIHRDIKLNNIVLMCNVCNNGSCYWNTVTDCSICTNCEIRGKIIDFGYATPCSNNILSASTTVLAFRSPEGVLMNHIDSSHDIWSLGCLLYNCLYTDDPYPDNDNPSVSAFMARVVSNVLSPEPLDQVSSWVEFQITDEVTLTKVKSKCVKRGKFPVKSLINISSQEKELMDDLIGKCLTIDRNYRPRPIDLLKHGLFRDIKDTVQLVREKVCQYLHTVPSGVEWQAVKELFLTIVSKKVNSTHSSKFNYRDIIRAVHLCCFMFEFGVVSQQSKIIKIDEKEVQTISPYYLVYSCLYISNKVNSLFIRNKFLDLSNTVNTDLDKLAAAEMTVIRLLGEKIICYTLWDVVNVPIVGPVAKKVVEVLLDESVSGMSLEEIAGLCFE